MNVQVQTVNTINLDRNTEEEGGKLRAAQSDHAYLICISNLG